MPIDHTDLFSSTHQRRPVSELRAAAKHFQDMEMRITMLKSRGTVVKSQGTVVNYGWTHEKWVQAPESVPLWAALLLEAD